VDLTDNNDTNTTFFTIRPDDIFTLMIMRMTGSCRSNVAARKVVTAEPVGRRARVVVLSASWVQSVIYTLGPESLMET
jgi:hypothetical protein